MKTHNSLSFQTRRNWWLDALLFSSAVLVALSGIYFLYLPNGYQGGRNPWYGITILFTRQTWDLIHTWSGVVMITVAAIHLALHWSWVTNMTRRTIKELIGANGRMNAAGRFNLVINALVAFGFFFAAISGVYFLVYLGGRSAVDPNILFSRLTWDMIHTWSGVIMIAAAVLHFIIHWKWVIKVTRKTLAPSREPKNPLPQTGNATTKVA